MILDDVPKWRWERSPGKKVRATVDRDTGKKRGKAVSPRSRYWNNLDYAGPKYNAVWGVSVKEGYELRIGRRVSDAKWRRLWAAFCSAHSYLEEYIGFPLEQEQGRMVRLALYQRWPGIEQRWVSGMRRSLAIEDAMRERVFRNLRYRCWELRWTKTRLEVEMWRHGWTVTFEYLKHWGQMTEFRSTNNWAITTMLADLVDVDFWDFVQRDYEADAGVVREWPREGDEGVEPWPDGYGKEYMELQMCMLDHRRSVDLMAAVAKLRGDRRSIWGKVERRYAKEGRDAQIAMIGLKQEIDRVAKEWEEGKRHNLHGLVKRLREAYKSHDADGRLRERRQKRVDDWVMANVYRSRGVNTDKQGEGGE